MSLTTIPYSTSAQGVLPPAAVGVTVTPSGVAWTSSAWVTLSAAAPSNAFLTGIAFRTGISSEFVEIDIGVGAAASEVVIATLRGLLPLANIPSDGCYIPCPIPISGILSGVRVAVRIRISSNVVTTCLIAATYLPNPYVGANLLTTAKPSKVYPPAASGISINDGGNAWVQGAWNQIVASAATDIVIVGISVWVNGAHNYSFQVDLGIGAPASEVVITTLAGFGNQEGIGFVPLWSPLDKVKAGNRLAVRCRTDGAFPYQNANLRIAVIYHEKPL